MTPSLLDAYALLVLSASSRDDRIKDSGLRQFYGRNCTVTRNIKKCQFAATGDM